MPLDALERLVNKKTVKTELGIKEGVIANWTKCGKSAELLNTVTKQAKRVFATLVLIDKADAIYGLLEEGLTDEHLPLVRDQDYPHLSSRDRETIFPFAGFRHASLMNFIHTQWLFLAPVLNTTGQLIKVNRECALPFTESDIIGNGAAGVVHWAKIHKAHQQRFEAEAVDLKVAVKQFLHKDDFDKENAILQQIKSLDHPHIIRHLVSIDKGDKGYIIFPWAAEGNLQEFWEASEQKASQKLVFWSLQQMLGLTTAVHKLHEQFNCRHGDLKPGNILCVQKGEELVLKIADFGVSRIHHAQTTYRKGQLTMSVLLTPSYQGPEVEFEGVDKNDPLPRSRKYDIWSLGCVFLEFTIWLLHGPEAIKGFTNARGNGVSSTNPSSPLYTVTSRSPKLAQVHKLVSWTIGELEHKDPRCEGETALATLLSLIKKQMLQIKVDLRPKATEICTQLRMIIQNAETRASYLLPPCDGEIVPLLDFKEFHLDAN